MSRSRDTLTADLFAIPRAPEQVGGSLDYATELRHALSDALKKSPKSRYEIAARMSELTGHDITKAMLDAWTAESRSPWRFPFEHAAAFEAACETTCLQELLARKRGCTVMAGEDVMRARLGRITQMRDELAGQERAIRDYLKTHR